MWLSADVDARKKEAVVNVRALQRNKFLNACLVVRFRARNQGVLRLIVHECGGWQAEQHVTSASPRLRSLVLIGNGGTLNNLRKGWAVLEDALAKEILELPSETSIAIVQLSKRLCELATSPDVASAAGSCHDIVASFGDDADLPHHLATFVSYCSQAELETYDQHCPASDALRLDPRWART